MKEICIQLIVISTLCYAAFSDSLGRCAENLVVTRSDFKLICQNGVLKPLACAVPLTGTDGLAVDVPINSTKTIEDFWVKCELDGNTLRYIREPRCVVEGKSYHVNDTIKAGSVIYQCLGTSIKPIGCYFLDSKNQEIKAQLGQTILIDHVQHRCRSAAPDQAHNSSCIVNGKLYNSGEKWDGGEGFIYECSADGYISITECVIENGVSVKVDQTRLYKNHLHSCVKSDSGIRYTSQPCGSVGVNCQGATIQLTDRHSAFNNSLNEVTCQVEGKVLKVSEKLAVAKGFVFQCLSDGSLTISDCVISPGVPLEVGKTLVQNNRLHKCVKTERGTVQYTAEPCGSNVECSTNKKKAPTVTQINSEDKTSGGGKPCVKNGISHAAGETWTSKGFKYLCSGSGRTSIIACATENNTEIPIGGYLNVNRTRYACELKSGGTVTLTYTQCSGETDCL